MYTQIKVNFNALQFQKASPKEVNIHVIALKSKPEVHSSQNTRPSIRCINRFPNTEDQGGCTGLTILALSRSSLSLRLRHVLHLGMPCEV